MKPFTPLKSSFTIGRVNLFATLTPILHPAIEGQAAIKAVEAFAGAPSDGQGKEVPPRHARDAEPAIKARDAWVEDVVVTRFEFSICQADVTIETRSGEMTEDIVPGWEKMPSGKVLAALMQAARALV